MEGIYIFTAGFRKICIKAEINHRFYLALIFKFYLTITMSFIVFNRQYFKFKSIISILEMFICVVLSLNLGIEGSVF